MADELDRLQARLKDIWPSMTLRTTRPQLRTVVVVHSLSIDLPASFAPVLPAYEERFLCMVLTLLRAPGSRVVYLTSQPIAPRVVDYWFGLTSGLGTAEARSRLFLVSPADGSPRPLTAKLLDRPRLLARIKDLVVDPELAMILPFISSELEARFALDLGIPMYGSHPRLWPLGSKSNARRLFKQEGIPCPAGVEAVRTRADLADALRELRAERPHARQAIIKLGRASTSSRSRIPTSRPSGSSPSSRRKAGWSRSASSERSSAARASSSAPARRTRWRFCPRTTRSWEVATASPFWVGAFPPTPSTSARSRSSVAAPGSGSLARA